MCQQYIWAPCNLQITLSELNKESIVLGNRIHTLLEIQDTLHGMHP